MMTHKHKHSHSQYKSKIYNNNMRENTKKSNEKEKLSDNFNFVIVNKRKMHKFCILVFCSGLSEMDHNSTRHSYHDKRASQ